jgi:hypothetical protein
VFCAGLAYLAEGFGKLVMVIGLVGVALSLFGFMKLKPEEGKTATPEGSAALKLAGIVVTWGGWFVTVVGLHLFASTGGRLVFALLGITVSLIGIIGVLPTAFGRKTAGKLQPSSFAPKTTMEHSR